MADIHNALKRGPWSAALSRALGMTQGTGPLERVGETLTPTLNLWQDPSWAYLRQETLLAWQGTVAAVAGEYSGSALVNPVGSGTIIVVDAVTAWSNVQLLFRLGRADAAAVTATFLTDGGRGNQRDTRYTAAFGPGLGHIWSGSDPAWLGTVLDVESNPAANAMAVFPVALPFVITPGWALVCQGWVVNNQVQTCFKWRERKALPGELE